MARIALYLSDEEYAEVERLAGEVPLSKWCKKRLFEKMTFPVEVDNGEGSGRRAVEPKRSAAVDTGRGRKAEVAGRGAKSDRVDAPAGRVGVRLDAVSEGGRGIGKVSVETQAVVPKKVAKTCPHGKPKGYNCGLCGGLAKVED